MKKYIILMVMLITLLPAVAQRKSKPSPEEWRKEMQQHKTSYIARALDLNEEQKEKFVPLYDEMCSKLDEVADNVRSLEKQVKNMGPSASDADYDKVSQSLFNQRLQEGKIESSYYTKFAKILSSKQMYEFKTAERKFYRKVMDEHRRRPRPQKTKN